MKVALVCSTLILLSIGTVISPVQAGQPDKTPWYAKRVIVGFHNNTSTNAKFVSTKFNLPIIMEDDYSWSQWAVFKPSNVTAFINDVNKLPMVEYGVIDGLGCATTVVSCGGGGGGGGTGTSPPDFTFTVNPSNFPSVTGTSTLSSTVTVAGIYGFEGSVNLAATVTPSTPSITPSLSPNMINILNADGSGTSTLSIQTNGPVSGTYIVTVTGTKASGGYNPTTHSVNVYVNVPFPGDPLYQNQWGPPVLNLPRAWQQDTGGTKTVIVAVADSGIFFNHPDLQGNLWTNPTDGSHGWNCVANPQNNNAADDFGHGTMVAGIIGAILDNGAGVAGTAQEKLMSVKVLDNTNTGTDATISCGIDWAVAHGASVINLSLGCACPSSYLVATPKSVAAAYQSGVLLVAASGNDNPPNGQVDCPACYSQAIAVSSLTQSNTLASDSDYGSKVELTAPGVGIESTYWPQSTMIAACSGQQYCRDSGTSYAAPFVSGIAALALDYSQNIGGGNFPMFLANQQIRDALDRYTIPKGTNACSGSCGPNPESGNGNWNSQFGYGAPDALQLLNNIISTHGLAVDTYYGNSGAQGATVSVYDVDSSTYLVQDAPADTLSPLNILPGVVLRVTYVRCFLYGTRAVLLNHIEGTGGAPSVQSNNDNFAMGAIGESTTAWYSIVPSC